MSKWARCLMVILAGSMIALAGSARAQDSEEPSVVPDTPRSGLTFSIGLGMGSFRCQNAGCREVTTAAGLEGHIGYMVTPSVAVLAEAWVMGHREDGLSVTHTLATVGLQAWVTQALWLRGGVGFAHAGFEERAGQAIVNDRSDTVLGLTAAIGVETLTRPDFAIDLVVRAGTGFYDDEATQVHSMMFGVAASWY